MHSSNSVKWETSGSEKLIPEMLITNYEMAVLSTLFEQADSGKVTDLAQQWGYQQDFLHAVWQQIHARMGDRPSKGT